MLTPTLFIDSLIPFRDACHIDSSFTPDKAEIHILCYNCREDFIIYQFVILSLRPT
jgi:hypothetical protein